MLAEALFFIDFIRFCAKPDHPWQKEDVFSVIVGLS